MAHPGPQGANGRAIGPDGDDAGELFDGAAFGAVFGGVIGLKRHIEDPCRGEHAEEGLHVADRIGSSHTDEQAEDDDMDEALGVLRVRDGADARD